MRRRWCPWPQRRHAVQNEHNWAGNYVYRAKHLHHPTSMDELRRIVSEAPRIHVLGSRHSFSDVGDAAELVSLDHLDQRIEIDKQTRTVTASGACRYGALA